MGEIKKFDWILIGSLLLTGILLLIGFHIWESAQSTGTTYAQVYYRDELILMIDLDTCEYKVYDTEYKDDIDIGRAGEGIFYVPGSVTSDMQELYEEDEYARDKGIVGIKLLVADGKIEVAYQESPRDICQLQKPTDSDLEPLVCLPNELVVSVKTGIPSGEFVPDSILE